MGAGSAGQQVIEVRSNGQGAAFQPEPMPDCRPPAGRGSRPGGTASKRAKRNRYPSLFDGLGCYTWQTHSVQIVDSRCVRAVRAIRIHVPGRHRRAAVVAPRSHCRTAGAVGLTSLCRHQTSPACGAVPST
eukprot:gene22158-biopygen13257